MSTALLLAFFAPSYATVAVPRPTWVWDYGKPVHYYLHTDLKFATTTRIWARNNLQERIGDLAITAEVDCTPAKLGKNVELSCSFAYLDFKATGVGSSKQADVDPIAAEWGAYGKTASITILLGANGHIKDFDVDDLERKTLRDGVIGDALRGYFMRLFAPLDFPLTDDDRDWVRGWEEKGVGYLLGLPISTQSAGAGTIRHTVEAERLGLIQVFSEGRGTVGAGAAVDASANGGLIDMRVAGAAWIDPAGILLGRGFSTDGQYIASASNASAGRYINQSAALQRVESFNADHSPPISPVAQRAPQMTLDPPAPPGGVQMVDFATLGMNPLFIEGMPQVAEGYELPRSTVKARAVVGKDGHVESVKAFAGYELLAEHVERGLSTVVFPNKGMMYAVDCEVEVRP